MSTINLNIKTKALIGQERERYPAGKSLQKQSGAVPLGCHAEINKSALIGQVRDTARYPAGITPLECKWALTLEVTNDNFHGVHRLELYIVAFLKNHCIANTEISTNLKIKIGVKMCTY